MTWRNPAARAVRWRLLNYGPATVMVVLGIVMLIAEGPTVAFAYGIAGLNMWIVAWGLRPAYRSGYWTGRADTQLELVRLKAPRRHTDPNPEPWDELEDPAELIALAQAQAELRREHGTE